MFDFVSNDTASTLSVPVVDKYDNPIDLTGCSVALHWADASGIAVSRDMAIDDEAGGVCSYKFLAGEIFAPSMSFEVEITDAGGFRVSCLEMLDVLVRKQLL